MTNKRVSNAKLRAELKYQFQFPDFRAGYAAAWKAHLSGEEVARIRRGTGPVAQRYYGDGDW